MLLPWLLVLHGILGGIDTLLNHEIIARLPHRAESRAEIGMHALRESIYGTLFISLAWREWHGAFAWMIGALLVAEIFVTAIDEFLENRTRVLPQNERVLHVFLTLNLGAIAAVAVPVLLGWSRTPTELVSTSHGVASWLLSALALAGFGWSVRDFVAWIRMGRELRHGGAV